MYSLTAKLRTIMAIDPLAVEIDFEGTEYTWGDLARVVQDVDDALGAMGLPPGARIGVLLRNRPEHIAAVIAVLAGAFCLVSLNPSLPDARLAQDIATVDAAVILGTQPDLDRLAVSQSLVAGGLAAVVLKADLAGAQTMLGHHCPECPVTTSPGIAIEMLTSGTTGAPKRVPLGRAEFEASFTEFTRYERGREFADAARLRSGVTMVVNPLTHIGGIYGCIAAVLAGRKIALLERFSVAGWVSAVRRTRTKVAPAVPSALRMILDAQIDPGDLASLSAIISGTAPLAPELVDAFLEKYDIPILGNYGATEFVGAVAGWTLDDFRAHWAVKRGAAGRIHQNVETRVIDPATGALLTHGSEGILELRGDQLGKRFAFGKGCWLRTTDRVIIDSEGFLFVCGRADNAINRGGFKVHPDHVVAALHEHPSIREAAVVGIPDPRLGEVPVAAIILREGVSMPQGSDLQAFLRDRLLPYQIPVAFRFVDDFPRTPSMKPSAPDLGALFASD